MKKGIFVEIISFLFIILFLYTGISKLIDYSIFKEQLALSPILSSFSNLVAILLPATELVVALLLFVPRTRLKGQYATLVLMILFTGYILYILNFNDKLPCSCGGIIEALTWKEHLIVNSLLILLAISSILLAKKHRISFLYKQEVPISILLFTFAFCLLGCGERKVLKTGFEGQPLPNASLLLVDSTTILKTSNIPQGKPIVLFFFSPECPYCRAETAKILANIDNLKDIQLYMITNFPFAQMKEYYSEYNIVSYKNIVMATDLNNVFYKYFKNSGIPFLAVYGKDKKLNGAFLGLTKTKNIQQLAND